MTKIREVLDEKGADVFAVRPVNTVYEAIQEMVNHNIGAVLVVSEDEKLVGIFYREGYSQAVCQKK